MRAWQVTSTIGHKVFGKCNKIKQNCTKPEKFNICYCLDFDLYYQKLISEWKTGH